MALRASRTARTASASIARGARSVAAEAAAKAQDVGAEARQMLDVRGAQRASEPGEEPGRVGGIDELLQPLGGDPIRQRAGALVARIQHHAGETGVTQRSNKAKVEAAIDEQHADEAHARSRAQPRQLAHDLDLTGPQARS